MTNLKNIHSVFLWKDENTCWAAIVSSKMRAIFYKFKLFMAMNLKKYALIFDKIVLSKQFEYGKEGL